MRHLLLCCWCLFFWAVESNENWHLSISSLLALNRRRHSFQNSLNCWRAAAFLFSPVRMVLWEERSSCNYVANLSYNDMNINKFGKGWLCVLGRIKVQLYKGFGDQKKVVLQCSVLYDTLSTAVGWQPGLEILLNAAFSDHPPYISPSSCPPSGLFWTVMLADCKICHSGLNEPRYHRHIKVQSSM